MAGERSHQEWLAHRRQQALRRIAVVGGAVFVVIAAVIWLLNREQTVIVEGPTTEVTMVDIQEPPPPPPPEPEPIPAEVLEDVVPGPPSETPSEEPQAENTLEAEDGGAPNPFTIAGTKGASGDVRRGGGGGGGGGGTGASYIDYLRSEVQRHIQKTDSLAYAAFRFTLVVRVTPDMKVQIIDVRDVEPSNFRAVLQRDMRRFQEVRYPPPPDFANRSVNMRVANRTDS